MPTTFTIARSDLRQTRWVETERTPLADGAVRFNIASFALTSNNVTYAAFGETMNYWGFFPTGDASTGCIPVWGFADVIESRCDGIAVGERFYGYWPIADETVLWPTNVKASSFVDGAPHRQALHALYNQYIRCSTDPGYVAAQEAQQALLRPLFITSFMIDDFLADNDFFGARRVVLSSASSKTAYGTAFCLSRRRGSDSAIEVIGLTSPGNLEFTRSLGCYDQVLTYADSTTLPAATPVVYVDFSGDAALRATIHGHWADALRYSCSVGGTHWDALGGGKGLAGPRPVLFFAPAQIKKRMGDWGPSGLQERLAEAWRAFMVPVGDAQHPWLRVVRGSGRAAVEAAYVQLLGGQSKPDEGHVLSV
ncbi:MAG TPA: DUF2855 family protein [Burkholderiaceae bacterium]